MSATETKTQASRQTAAKASSNGAGLAGVSRMPPGHGNEFAGNILQGKSMAAAHGSPNGIPNRKIQTKLSVGPAHDRYEQEADRIADQVMRMDDSTPASLVDTGKTDTPSTAQPQALAGSISSTSGMHRSGGDGGFDMDSQIEQQINGRAGGGRPLPGPVMEKMEAPFGTRFDNVRIHTGSEANTLNQQLNAKAFTHGADIFFAEGQYRPDTVMGRHLLAHELTHVAQQGAGGESATKTATAASPTTIRRFAQGTTKINKNGEYQGGTGHAGMTEEALQGMGLNAREARQGRLGNWERDMSQALTPGTVALLSAEKLMPVLNILAIEEFGRGLNPAEFGTYDPVEHIDNPTDLRGSDVFNQVNPADPDGGLTYPTNPDVGVTSKLKGTEGPANKGYAAVDQRYALTQTKGAILNPQDAAAFQVDQSAIPRYLNTSKLWLTAKLHQSANLGRKMKDGLGPREFSSGIHTMQDYYAHTNFCEIGINILIREGGLEIVVADDGHGGKKTQVLGKDKVLNTQVHANGADGNPLLKNLVNAGAVSKSGKKETREVLTTGSFNLTDTGASVLEEVADKIKKLNPFDKNKKGPNTLIMACLDYLELDENNPEAFNTLGKQIAERIRGSMGIISALAPQAAAAAGTAGNLGAGAVREGASQASGALSVLNRINGALGGDNDYFDSDRKKIIAKGDAVAGGVKGAAEGLSKDILNINMQLEAVAKAVDGRDHMLRTAYQWAYENNPLTLIKAAARKIPVIGEKIAAEIESLEKTINKLMEDTLGAAWNAAVTKTVAGLNRVIAKIRAKTNIERKKREAGTGTAGKLGGASDLYDENGSPKEGIAPKSYTPPSHTEIAKDHDDIVNPARDGKADHEGKDEHGHNHISSYLAPLATGLGKMASNAIGKKVAACWDIVDAGGKPTARQLAEIDAVVEVYFAHPADCDYWQDYFKAMLKTARIGGEVDERLGNY